MMSQIYYYDSDSIEKISKLSDNLDADRTFIKIFYVFHPTYISYISKNIIQIIPKPELNKQIECELKKILKISTSEEKIQLLYEKIYPKIKINTLTDKQIFIDDFLISSIIMLIIDIKPDDFKLLCKNYVFIKLLQECLKQLNITHYQIELIKLINTETINRIINILPYINPEYFKFFIIDNFDNTMFIIESLKNYYQTIDIPIKKKRNNSKNIKIKKKAIDKTLSLDNTLSTSHNTLSTSHNTQSTSHNTLSTSHNTLSTSNNTLSFSKNISDIIKIDDDNKFDKSLITFNKCENIVSTSNLYTAVELFKRSNLYTDKGYVDISIGNEIDERYINIISEIINMMSITNFKNFCCKNKENTFIIQKCIVSSNFKNREIISEKVKHLINFFCSDIHGHHIINRLIITMPYNIDYIIEELIKYQVINRKIPELKGFAVLACNTYSSRIISRLLENCINNISISIVIEEIILYADYLAFDNYGNFSINLILEKSVNYRSNLIDKLINHIINIIMIKNYTIIVKNMIIYANHLQSLRIINIISENIQTLKETNIQKLKLVIFELLKNPGKLGFDNYFDKIIFKEQIKIYLEFSELINLSEFEEIYIPTF